MKKTITILMILLMLPLVMAEDKLTENTINPDSALWGLDIAFEKIQLALASKENKVNLRLQFALERLQEIKERKDNKIAINKAMSNYNEQMSQAETEAEYIQDKEKAIEAHNRIKERTQIHLEHMNQILEKVPEQAKFGLTTAISRQEEQKVRFQETKEIVFARVDKEIKRAGKRITLNE